MNDAARNAYDTMAPGYDEYTSANDYEMWLGRVLLPELEKRGLRHGRVLDAGCGTGRAFAPLLRRGWEVVGCDVSPAMLEEASRKFPDVPVSTADLRQLPELGRFDLVLALNDVVNYLTEDGDLEHALSGIAANLAPGGLLLFDANTLGSFRDAYTPEAGALGTYNLRIEGPGLEPHVHRQRHFSVENVRAAIEAADLALLAALGQREAAKTVLLSGDVDEERDEKIVFIAG